MPEYLSPGVYVEEVPSAIKPIAGVSTSTAAFVGVVPDQIIMVEESPNFDPSKKPYKDFDLSTKDAAGAAKPLTAADIPKDAAGNPDLATFLKGQNVDNSRFIPWIFPLPPDDAAIANA